MERFFLSKALLFTLFSFASCVSMSKQEQGKSLMGLPSLDKSRLEGLESGVFVAGEWPGKNWWECFESPELNQLILKALQENPTLKSVRHRFAQAEEYAKMARSRLFPLVRFTAEEEWLQLSHNGLYRALNEEIPISASLINLTLSFFYEFDFWGKNRNLFKAAVGEARAQAAEAAQAELITATSVAQTYFSLKINSARRRLHQKLVEVRRARSQLTTFAREHALLSLFPPLSAEESLLEAENQLIKLEEEVETDRHLLNILVGNGPDTPLPIELGSPFLLATLIIPDTLSLDLLARRPDLMTQIWRVEALAHTVGAAKADFYPNINLLGFIGLESVYYSKVFSAGSETGGLAPALHLPLFTAGAIRANVRAKKAEFDSAVSAYNALILKAVGEVADILVEARSLFTQKCRQEEIVARAEAQLMLTEARLAHGLDGRFACYTLEEELIAKELEALTLLYGQFLASLRLIQALGGGYLSEEGVPLTAERVE